VEWRKLHNEELYALYGLPNIIWLIKSRKRGSYRVVVGGGHDGERPLGRPRGVWENKIEMDL